MDGSELRTWRQKWGFSQAKLSKALGVSTMAVAYWEWGQRRIPPLLPLALEALENRMKEEGKHGLIMGMPKVQEKE
ncbi:MAG: helix-turn-helix transcriptional regulator [Deltaproteobacteria bacterium]|nr:helix-turn-helix transcriptional regulator [Deltaproteobacteria bacterium]